MMARRPLVLAVCLALIVAARMLQGFSGGLLMPLSLTLLLRLFPKEKAALANGLWAVTTLVAPVVGPILGGWLCDNYTWPWAFYLNAPIAFIGAAVVAQVLWTKHTCSDRTLIDTVGLGLLILWVTALQVMLDKGKDLDWFASDFICVLAVVVVIGFISFLIWESTEQHPIVDLRVFRHRGFSATVFTTSVAYAAFFTVNVLVPLWLQTNMGYTATWTGKTVAWMGVLAIAFTPVVIKLIGRVDSRLLIFLGVGWVGVMVLWLGTGNNDMTYWDVALPFFFMGAGLSFIIAPATGLALSSVDEKELDSAAGLMNFTRTICCAIATSLVTTAWENSIKYNRAELAAISQPTGVINTVRDMGVPPELARGIFERLVESQSITIATNQILWLLAFVMFVSALSIWIAPKQARAVDTSKVH